MNDNRYAYRIGNDPHQERAYLVAGVWYPVHSEVKYVEGEHRFITIQPDYLDRDFFEMHVMSDQIQAIAWPFDGFQR